MIHRVTLVVRETEETSLQDLLVFGQAVLVQPLEARQKPWRLFASVLGLAAVQPNLRARYPGGLCVLSDPPRQGLADHFDPVSASWIFHAEHCAKVYPGPDLPALGKT